MTDSIRVLHVDDNPEFAEMAATFLETEDDRLTVETAHSARDGLEQMADGEFDCIISDYEMPGQSGIEFLKAVRETHAELPFILYTGKGSEAVASDAISAGVTDYLQKEAGTEQYELLANRVRHAVERRRAQRARQRHLKAIETAQEGISILDEDGEFVYVNEVWGELFGYDPEELLGERWELLYRQGEVERLSNDIFPTVWETGSWRGETTGLRADGSTFAQDHTISETETGEIVCTVQDITERREREQELQQERAFIDRALGQLNDVLYVVGTDGSLRRWNDQLSKVTGYDDDEIADMQATEFFPEDEQERIAEAINEALTAGEVVIESEFLSASGERIPFELTGSRLLDSDGDLFGLIGVGRDISERREREQAVKELHSTARALIQADTSEEMANITISALRDVLEMPINAVFRHDETDDALTPIAWTDRAETLFDDIPTFTSGEGIAWTVFETGEARVYDDVSTVPERHNPDTKARSEIILPLADHGVVIIGSTESEDFDEIDVSLAQTLTTHLTTALDNLKQRTELLEKTGRLEALYENSPDMIDILDSDGQILDVNRRFCEELGYTRNEVLGRPICEIDQSVDADEVRTLLSEFATGERQKFTGTYVRADDSTVPVEVHLLRVDLDGDDRFVAISRDITDRERRERRLRQQTTQFESFGDILSHDLRGPLNVLEGRLELARRTGGDEHFDAAERALDRLDSVIQDVADVMREGQLVNERVGIEPADVAQSCWKTLNTTSASLVVEKTQPIYADKDALARLFDNLLRNAVEHAGMDVTVRVGMSSDGFYVEDDGEGIPDDNRADVFDPGFSTKEDGTGFGMVSVQQIALAHGWDVTIAESDTGGARFEFADVETA